jgi:hypothetical protein
MAYIFGFGGTDKRMTIGQNLSKYETIAKTILVERSRGIKIKLLTNIIIGISHTSAFFLQRSFTGNCCVETKRRWLADYREINEF